MKRKKYFLVFLLVIFCSLSCQAQSNELAEIRSLNIQLRSHDSSEASLALKGLFKKGAIAIPFLLANFKDTNEYYGGCGFITMDSHYTQTNIDEFIAKEPPKDESPSKVVFEIREASLYLVLAIMRNDIFFANHCEPVYSKDKSVSLDHALAEISNNYEFWLRGERPFTSKDVKDILTRYGISFDIIE